MFPNSVTFDSPADQEAFVREWAQKRTGLACGFKVRFYPGRYAPEKGEQSGVDAVGKARSNRMDPASSFAQVQQAAYDAAMAMLAN